MIDLGLYVWSLLHQGTDFASKISSHVAMAKLMTSGVTLSQIEEMKSRKKNVPHSMITLLQTQLRAQDGQQQNHLIQRGLDHLHGEKSFQPFPGNQLLPNYIHCSA